MAITSMALINIAVLVILVGGVRVSVAGPPCVTRDVNGDSTLNIGDPIYLLQFLFRSLPIPWSL